MEVILLGGIIGIAAGLRSMTAPAVVSAAARRGDLSLDGTPLAMFGHPAAPLLLGAMAVGEVVADKLPGMPPRTLPAPLLVRLIAGGLAGAAIGAARGQLRSGLAAGVAGAAIGARVGIRLREQVAAGVGPMPAALAEDALAVGLAIAAMAGARA